MLLSVGGPGSSAGGGRSHPKSFLIKDNLKRKERHAHVQKFLPPRAPPSPPHPQVTTSWICQSPSHRSSTDAFLRICSHLIHPVVSSEPIPAGGDNVRQPFGAQSAWLVQERVEHLCLREDVQCRSYIPFSVFW